MARSGMQRENSRVSERRACRLLGQWRGTQGYDGIYRTDEDALTRDITRPRSDIYSQRPGD